MLKKKKNPHLGFREQKPIHKRKINGFSFFKKFNLFIKEMEVLNKEAPFKCSPLVKPATIMKTDNRQLCKENSQATTVKYTTFLEAVQSWISHF